MGFVSPRRLTTAGAVPTAAGTNAGEILTNVADSKVFLRGSTAVGPVAGVGYLQKNVLWSQGAPAPLDSFEFLQRVYLFATGQLEQLVAWVRVPSGFTPGSIASLRLLAYSPSITNVFRLQALVTLVRKNVDAVTATANQRTVTTGDVANVATANVVRELSLDLTDANGAVGAAAVSAGDLLQIVLSRVAPTGADDTADLRLVADAAELLFN